jgi:hypothetical protein
MRESTSTKAFFDMTLLCHFGIRPETQTQRRSCAWDGRQRNPELEAIGEFPEWPFGLALDCHTPILGVKTSGLNVRI